MQNYLVEFGSFPEAFLGGWQRRRTGRNNQQLLLLRMLRMLRLLLLLLLLLLLNRKPRPHRCHSFRPVAGTLAPLLLVLAPLQLPGLFARHRKPLLGSGSSRKRRFRRHLLAIQRVVLVRFHFDASGRTGRSAGH